MPENWKAEVVKRMYLAGITGQMLALESGYSAAYLSTVLHNERGTEQTKTKILEALERLENREQGCSSTAPA